MPAYEYGLPGVDTKVHRPKVRAVFEGIASVGECQHAVGATVLAMDPYRADDDDDDDGGSEYNGERTLIVSPPSLLKASVGEGASRLVSLFLWRITVALRDAFVEDRGLFLSGALLTRLQPPPRRRAPTSGNSYAYSVAHVDRANVASYDYSAVLYLNTKGEAYEGGDFAFVDDDGDEIVEPRMGRCVIFSSGYEHLHRVERVTSGCRFALAAWFTLTEAVSEGCVLPAHYKVEDPLPPPTVEDIAAGSTRIDDLKAAIERMFS